MLYVRVAGCGDGLDRFSILVVAILVAECAGKSMRSNRIDEELEGVRQNINCRPGSVFFP